MPRQLITTMLAALLFAAAAPAAATEAQPTALSCDDFKPTDAALERFPDLVGACEAVVERDGELFAKFVAIVRRANNRSVTLYLPATDRTFTVNPNPDTRVLLGGRSARAGDLARGQEIRIYLATSQFAQPDIEEVALVTEEDIIITMPVSVPSVDALPTTASPWPALGMLGALLLGAGAALRRVRRRKADHA